MWQHFCLTGRIIGKKNFNILMTHLKADVATFLSYRQNNREKNFNILMTHLKVDVAIFLSYRQNYREKHYFNYFHHLFSLISTL
jgi:hypothetical protein